MSKPTLKKLYPLLLLIPLLLIFIIQALACNEGACATSNSVCIQDDKYIDQFYNPGPPDIPHINVEAFIEKSADVSAGITCKLFDNKKDFLYSDTCLCLNDLLNRHMRFPNNTIIPSIQKKKILYQSADDSLPLL